MAETPSIDDLRIDRQDEDRGAGRRPYGRLALFALVLLAAALGAWWWLGRSQAAAVTVATVRSSAAGAGAGAVLDASGYVTARRQATVSSKVTGKIEEVLVEEGMVLEEGQVLARLDDATARRQLALAEAEGNAARRAVQETAVLLAEARLTLGRTENLTASGVSSVAELDAAQARVDSLAARLELSRQQVEVADRRLALSRQQLDDTVIRAPFSGVAISKNAQPGEMISPVSAGGGFTRTGICTLVDMTSLEFEVDVNEAYINRVSPEQPVEGTLDAYPDWKIPGRVITTVPAADRQKATVKVRIRFDALGDPRVLPDMGVKVSFLEEERPEAAESAPRLRVPIDAVRREGDRDVVFVLTGERAERRAVTLGPRSDGEVEVEAGLQAGERVVVEGPEDLADGDAVTHEP